MPFNVRIQNAELNSFRNIDASLFSSAPSASTIQIQFVLGIIIVDFANTQIIMFGTFSYEKSVSV